MFPFPLPSILLPSMYVLLYPLTLPTNRIFLL